MVGDSRRHAAALGELVGWWQDLARQEINSRAVLLAVPPRWGRTFLLNQFAASVEDDAALSIVIRVPGKSLPDGLGAQAQKLRDLFRETRVDHEVVELLVEHRVAEKLGVDTPSGVIQLGLGVGGLFVSSLAAQVGLLLAGVGVGAAGRWDDSAAGQEGPVARLARRVGAVSVSVPVVVVIDDADRLEPDLVVVLVENLVERFAGHVLVVAVVNPDGDLMPALIARSAYGLTEGRVRRLDVDPGMGFQERVDLTTELCPNLPGAAIRRIGQRTRTFTEVFTVASAERLTELDPHGDDAATVTMVDKVINARVDRDPPSGQAVVLAWAGGILHSRQADRAADILGWRRENDGDVLKFESLVRLADLASPRLAEQVDILSASERHRLAEIVLSTAVQIGEDPQIGLVDKIVAWQAAHRIRDDLQNRARLTGVQCQLVHGLEDLGDLASAYQVAKAALAEYRTRRLGDQRTPEQDYLSAAVLRLARNCKLVGTDPFIEATVAVATAGGAAVGLEACMWAAIDLLAQPGKRERALELTDQVTAELSQQNDLGAIGNRWRLQLALHAGRAGYHTAAQRLLAPMLNAPHFHEGEDAAQAVLYAIGGPKADTRLQIIGLEAELAVLPPDAEDDLLRVHFALGADYESLGYYSQALYHGRQELSMRQRIQGADHPNTLRARSNIALRTDYCGNSKEALLLLSELLPDQERILGPAHHDTLTTRSNIASCTGHSGRSEEALRLSQELLSDAQRVLGSNHPDTLLTRGNIALWTGECGRSEEALRLFQQLLPDEVQVLGPDDSSTLGTRNNIASWTGHCGRREEALRLFQQLLPDQERVIGPDHPDTLAMRSNMAFWTGECGRSEEALRLFQQLLPDRQRVIGPDHPDTLSTRSNMAFWTGECGRSEEALRLFQQLLPDRQRVIGPDHSDTLSTRNNIAVWTDRCGRSEEALRLFQQLLLEQQRVLGPSRPETLLTRYNIAADTGKLGRGEEALRLYQQLLPDEHRVLGPRHPRTLRTRSEIASWTAECGRSEEALRLYQQLLPDQERVIGPDHPDILTTRRNIASGTGECGHGEEALRLFNELLPDLERVLGPDHPDTLTARNHFAFWTWRCGDGDKALRLLRDLLADEQRVLGPSHHDTLITQRAIQQLDR